MKIEKETMWNDKIEATPKVRPEWLVPVFFTGAGVITFVTALCLAVIGKL